MPTKRSRKAKALPTEERKRVSASVSAKTINALAPLIRQVAEMTWSDVNFMRQVETRHFGVYLMPVVEGILIAVVDNARIVIVRDPKGHASEVIKVHFPTGLLDAIKPRVVELFDENGTAFEVESDPKAGLIFCNELFGMVAIDTEGEKKYKGVLGTWANGDHGNVIDAGSWRAEPADVAFIRNCASKLLKETPAPIKSITINPALLAPICQVAESLWQTPVEFQFTKSGAVIIRSSAHSALLAFLMPMLVGERGVTHSIELEFVPATPKKKVAPKAKTAKK